jgi:hypothetical protein
MRGMKTLHLLSLMKFQKPDFPLFEPEDSATG